MLFCQYPFSVEQQGRGGSSNLAASKVETFAIIVYFQKPLSIIAKGSILDMKEVPDPPVKCLSITLFTLFKRSLLKKLMRRVLKTAFAFYQFNEYVIVTLNVNNGGTNICCDCETFKVFLTSNQIGFGHSDVGKYCFNGRRFHELADFFPVHCACSFTAFITFFQMYNWQPSLVARGALHLK